MLHDVLLLLLAGKVYIKMSLQKKKQKIERKKKNRKHKPRTAAFVSMTHLSVDVRLVVDQSLNYGSMTPLLLYANKARAAEQNKFFVRPWAVRYVRHTYA